ncbi:MAG: hypothetical protein ACD_28C00394G0005 [uncultured bacterium]|nr:MAG: hypothetical protein ACD_28C00394G0005 [uncultured bacterium]KKT73105.1 MAG: hypothetical protein UW70_C0091G0004 [Candidatus Peregrinibacteria bacterium GW2011_GWA2_44_7]
MTEKLHPSSEAQKKPEKPHSQPAQASFEQKDRRAQTQRLRNSILERFDQKFSKSANESDLLLIELLNRAQKPETLNSIHSRLEDFFKSSDNNEDFVMDLAEAIENREPGALSRIKSMPSDYTDFTQETIVRYRNAREEAEKAMKHLVAIDTLNPAIRKEVLCSFTELMARGFRNPELKTGGDIPGGRMGMFYVLSSPKGEKRYVWRSDGQVHLNLPPALKRTPAPAYDEIDPAIRDAVSAQLDGLRKTSDEEETENQEDENSETTKEMNVVTPELREKVVNMSDTELMTYYDTKFSELGEMAAKGSITPDILVEGKMANNLDQANRILNNQITDPEEAREILLDVMDNNF